MLLHIKHFSSIRYFMKNKTTVKININDWLEINYRSEYSSARERQGKPIIKFIERRQEGTLWSDWIHWTWTCFLYLFLLLTNTPCDCFPHPKTHLSDSILGITRNSYYYWIIHFSTRVTSINYFLLKHC